MEQRSREEQIEFIMEHYEDPINWGSMEDADVVQKMGNPGCGDIVTVYLKVNERDEVERVSFEGEGCTISMAGTSMLVEMIEGKPLSEVETMPQDLIIDLLGRELAMTRPRCTTLGLSAVRLGLKAYRRNQMLAQVRANPGKSPPPSTENGVGDDTEA